MQAQQIPIGLLDPNSGQIEGLPQNPRFIRDVRFAKLVQSIRDDPEMMELRECLVYPVEKRFVVIGGNMRLRALRELKYTDVPCKVLDVATPPEKLRAYAIKDNVGFGQDDTDLLSSEWDENELVDWGVEVPGWDAVEEPSGDDLIGENRDKPATMKITFKSVEQLQQAEIDIQELIDRKYAGAYFSVSAGEL